MFEEFKQDVEPLIESIEENSTQINGKEDIARVASISANDKVVLDKAIEVASNAGVEFAKGVEIQKIMQKYAKIMQKMFDF